MAGDDRGEERRAPHERGEAPFGVKLLICFLLADSVRRGLELAKLGFAAIQPQNAIFILWFTTNLLLAALLALGTRAGRFWTQTILLVHIFFLVHSIAVQDPYLWVVMGLTSRTKILVTIFIDALLFAYLTSKRARIYLAH